MKREEWRVMDALARAYEAQYNRVPVGEMFASFVAKQLAMTEADARIAVANWRDSGLGA